jgi:hypothetical protein
MADKDRGGSQRGGTQIFQGLASLRQAMAARSAPPAPPAIPVTAPEDLPARPGRCVTASAGP